MLGRIASYPIRAHGRRKSFGDKGLRRGGVARRVVSPLLVTTYNYFIYFGKLWLNQDFICGQTGFFAVMYIEDKSSLVFRSLNYAIWNG